MCRIVVVSQREAFFNSPNLGDKKGGVPPFSTPC